MDVNRLTEKAQEALQAAHRRAIRESHQQLDVEHLFLALLEQEDGLAIPILQKAGVTRPDRLKERLEQELRKLPRVSGVSGGAEQLYITGRLNRLLVQAEDEAKKLRDEYISVEHLLLALLEDTGFSCRLLREYGVNRENLMTALQQIRGHQRVTSPTPETTYQALA
ncbi:Chaperone protein ClpB 1 [bacterium HR36]|nr:Chaperone protein ClpB 1 [bacterium HR36]